MCLSRRTQKLNCIPIEAVLGVIKVWQGLDMTHAWSHRWEMDILEMEFEKTGPDTLATGQLSLIYSSGRLVLDSRRTPR